ncbi:MAG: S-(hydroxymethyl)glutathione dehydrogenase/alcohol dehydrogenase [Candidatus Azotimanducaceae bacterium]|jgi:S-(hydroxymethyl)glutathione dehydrogenase/alcohol dehydrogenase
MKAAILEAANKPLIIEDVDIIDPRAGEVLVRTSCSGVCHSDLHFVDGSWQLPMACVLGHEASGVVEAIGAGVTYVKPGDRVIMSFKPFCGKCYYCLGGRPNLCNDPEIGAASASRLTHNGKPILQFASVGSFAEMMVTSENGVVKIPEEMPMAEAALIGCGVMTGVGAALYTAQVPGGADVAIIGCGGIGLNIVQGCRIAGAAKIIAIDIIDSKLEMATNFGATHTINSKDVDDLEGAIKEITGGVGVEYAFEAIGVPAAATQAFNITRAGGTAVVVGMHPLGSQISIPGPAFLQEKKLIGCMYGSTRFREHMPKLIDLFLQDKLDLTSLVSRRLKLEDVNEAFRSMKAGEVARSVLEF